MALLLFINLAHPSLFLLANIDVWHQWIWSPSKMIMSSFGWNWNKSSNHQSIWASNSATWRKSRQQLPWQVVWKKKLCKFSSTNPGGRFKLLLRFQRRWSTETKAAGCLKQSHPLHRIACKNVLIHLTNLKDCHSHKKNTLSLCYAATTTATSNSPFPQRHFLHPQFSAGTGHPLWEFLLSILSDIITMMLIHCWDDVT